mmetsp:Transcript_68752/g.109090  ORF Transcript_68752/g.109090 Transcript_68752/m.109090 type:complete len:173 (-) Transcript_68752:52-570(-)|eukprot:CAMPEP_0169114130 /NCGR_PEP_ID=MMETSP1015-20121227/28579_1 /TAXON_ID=342587 /ORGANISM="Karlodinium micrum, Strain CCMP2283" /LENGTH=172 /DNA_ID=CAMNT_0009176363 /DNA_START=77 /DNA_END=595 /DNA_ORIENTATION=-
MGHAGQAKCTHRTLAKKRNPRKVKASQKPTKLRSSITPGTVLILLAGRFRGRRVVFLKQLESGLLLVTGPYAINGVPLRRVNQRFCIATSTKVDVGTAGSKISDAFFAREGKKAKRTDGMFATEKVKEALSDDKKNAQKEADKAVKADGDVKSYLKARFSLSANMYPHDMKF